MRRFRFKLTIQNSVFLQLAVIAGIIAFNYAVVVIYDQDLSDVEKTIDVAESNGTHSQKTMLYASLLHQGKDQYKSRLTESVGNFDEVLQLMRIGGKSPQNGAFISPVPAELLSGYLQPLEVLWQKFREQALILAQKPRLLGDNTLNPEVQDAYNYLLANHAKLLERNDRLVRGYLQYFDQRQDARDRVLGIIFVINIALIILMFVYIAYNVVRPISKLNEIDAIIREGNFDRNIDYTREDELGKVAQSINKLFRNLRNATEFILAIGEGKLDSEYQRDEDTDARNDRLGNALQEMRDKMSQVAESDYQRNWASEGLAKFAEILRTQSQSEEFTYIIISNLVKYVEANQGGLYLVADQLDGEAPALELVAAYAYEKRKYLQQRIKRGEGLIGEVFREGLRIYMTDLPQDYIHITSGLGGSNPRALLLVPLKLNDDIYGVVEIASFEPLETYQIEFVERLGESIASTFATVKNAHQTERLLRESIQLGEQMKAQEEEMRQNLEELMATQEEVERKNYVIEEQKKDLERSLAAEQRKVQELQMERNYIEKQIQALQAEKQELERKLREQMTA